MTHLPADAYRHQHGLIRVPTHCNHILFGAINHFNERAVRQVPHVKFVFPRIGKRAAEVLTVPAEVTVDPAYAVDGVLVLLRTIFAVIVGVQSHYLHALIALQKKVGENILGVARPDLSEGRRAGA